MSGGQKGTGTADGASPLLPASGNDGDMTFLNLPILLGLTGVAIPILIHLFNRRHAKIVDWGAMQFLLSSLTSRRRRVLIEEVLLMCIRCLLVALLVLAVARPLLPVHGAVSWIIVLPMVLAASVCAAIGAVSWAQRRARWILLATAAVLVLIGVAATMAEYWWQGGRWSGKGTQDIVIVVDASTSMMLTTDGKTTFDRALGETRRIVKGCKRGDAVSVILAGATPRELSSTPMADTDEVLDLLEGQDVKAMGGTMDAIAALDAAVSNAAEGNNAGKKIVLLTDSQKVGWGLGGSGRWRFLAEATEEMPIKPQIICRTLRPEANVPNAAVVDIAVSREVVGTDRAVEIDVKIANAGSQPVEALPVMLLVDGKAVKTVTATDIDGGAEGAVSFQHRFADPGPHMVAAQIGRSDALEADNTSYRTVTVLDQLPVLIVDGGIDSGADALATALAPPPLRASGAKDPAHLLKPKLIKAIDAADEGDFSQYRLVVLADVPRLAESTCQRLAAYVADGGGLLITPGAAARPEFYNRWRSGGEMRLTPALLGERVIDNESPAMVAARTLNHPALAKLVGDRSDIAEVITLAHWDLSADASEIGVSIAGRFNTGKPMLVERAFGKGFVLMTAMSFDEADGNMASHECFITLAHEMAYYLAAPRAPRANVLPAGAITLRLLCPRTAKAAPPTADALAQLGGNGAVDVVTPSGTRTGKMTYSAGAVQLAFSDTAEPGKYHFVLPKDLAAKFPGQKTGENAVPFAVHDPPGESNTERLSDEDFKAVSKHVEIYPADSYEKVATALAGQIPGEELWSYLALTALALVLGEIALTRWIERRRHAQGDVTVDFSGEGEKAEAFKARARSMLAGDSPEAA